jgi:hypothetical protein
MISRRIHHRSAWRPADLPSKDVMSFDLGRRHIAAFDRALGRLRALGDASLAGIDRHGFDLAPIADEVVGWYRELRDGRGIVNLRGFPVAERSIEELSLIYYGLALQFGKPVSQSVLGDRIGHVVAVDKLLHGERRRSYKSTHEMRLHTDYCDLLGMLCIRPAAAGGASRYTSGASVHNEILATRPKLLEPLYRGFHYWRIGESPEEPVTPYRVPIFACREGLLSVQHAGDRTFIAPEKTGVPITEEEREAVDYFEEVAEREDIRYEFRIEAGECFFANNLIHLHARSAIENSPDPRERRHLLRIWVDCDPSFRPVPPELRVFGHGRGVPARPEMVHEAGG